MADDSVQRRLAAILFADIAGYGALMNADEEATVAALRANQDVLLPLIAAQGGRVIDLAGDGVLAEFSSVLAAMQAALAMQAAMAERNAASPPERAMQFRIGINLGDVLTDGTRIYGDGINVAARLQALAEPGGICVSGKVYDDVRDRLDLPFRDLGERSLKNIARPVRVYALGPGPTAADDAAQASSPVLPSLAVLPFSNLSSDPEQDFFADGVVEDIITALSRFRSFAVVARNSSFVFKGKAVDVRQAAAELGVRYVLEGSVRRAGQRLRITAQLLDGESGAHLWAEHFDGLLDEVFDFQERITATVVALVAPRVRQAEIERSRRDRPAGIDAYDLKLRGTQKLMAWRPEENIEAIELLERAVAADPGNASTLALLANAYEHRFTMGWPSLTDDDGRRSVELARAALGLQPDDPNVMARCGLVLAVAGGEYAYGRSLSERALSVNPNDIEVINLAGITHQVAGEFARAKALFERVLQLSPADTSMGRTNIAIACISTGQFEEGLRWALESLAENEMFNPTHWAIIAAKAHLGRLDEAAEALDALRRISPEIAISRIGPGRARDADLLVAGLRLAGMPED